DAGACSFGLRKVTEGMAETASVVRMKVEGGEMDARADVLAVQRLRKLVAGNRQLLEVEEHEEEVTCVAVGRVKAGVVGNVNAPNVGETLSVCPRVPVSDRPVRLDPTELVDPQRCLKVCEVVVVARVDGLVGTERVARIAPPGIARETVQSTNTDLFGPIVPIGRNHAAFGGREVLRCVEAERRNIRVLADGAPSVARFDCVRTIADDREVMRARKLDQRMH